MSYPKLLTALCCLLLPFAQSKAQLPNHYENIFGNCNQIQMLQNTTSKNCDANSINRNIDGTCNNLLTSEYGSTQIPFARKSPAAYSNANGGMIDRGNPREISNLIFDQQTSVPSGENLSSFLFAWLQFVDHNITLTPVGDVAAPITVTGDPDFGNAVIPFTRSAQIAGTLEQQNNLTAWLDGAAVYGADDTRATWLRSGASGGLKTSIRGSNVLLPCNTTTGDCFDPIDPAAPRMDGDEDTAGNRIKIFVAGDPRASEHPGLTSLHTLFVLEHNRICKELIDQGTYQANEDELIYQHARRVVGGLIQAITYNEALPALGIDLDPYSGYNANKSPDILNEFSTAAFRLGHTMVPEDVRFLDNNGDEVSILVGNPDELGDTSMTGQTFSGSLPLLAAFFNPTIVGFNGIENVLKGLSQNQQEEIDGKVVDGLRNALFGPPGAGGLDLVALNIQRGRDHGLPGYNAVRNAFGLPSQPIAGITPDLNVQNAISQAYGTGEIDPWVGMVLEGHLPNSSVGETLHAIIKEQFENIRDADRFWYASSPGLSAQEKSAIANTSLSDVIERNVALTNLGDVFHVNMPSFANYCTPQYTNNNTSVYINSVTLEDISNNNTGASQNTGSYSDYTNLCTTLSEGNSYTMEVLLNSSLPGSGADADMGVWVDWNQDGVFSTSERIFISTGNEWLSSTQPRLKNISFTVPQGALSGNTVMRIRVGKWQNVVSIDPCSTEHFGETEDYCINVGGCPEVPSISGATIIEEGATAIYSIPSEYAGADILWTISGGAFVGDPTNTTVIVDWGNGSTGTLGVWVFDGSCTEVGDNLDNAL